MRKGRDTQLLFLHGKKLSNLHCGCVLSSNPGMRIGHPCAIVVAVIIGMVAWANERPATRPTWDDPNDPNSRKGFSYRNQGIGVVH